MGCTSFRKVGNRHIRDHPDNITLQIGALGRVVSIDTDGRFGAALIDFEGISQRQWVDQSYFSNLKLAEVIDGKPIIEIESARAQTEAAVSQFITEFASANDLQSQMLLVQTGPTVDALVQLLEPEDYSMGHWEGARFRQDILTEQQYAMAKDLLHTVANAIRIDPQQYDIIFANKGEKIKKPLLQFLEACNSMRHLQGNVVTGMSGHFSDYEVSWSGFVAWKPGIAVQVMPLRSWNSIEIVLADAAYLLTQMIRQRDRVMTCEQEGDACVGRNLAGSEVFRLHTYSKTAGELAQQLADALGTTSFSIELKQGANQLGDADTIDDLSMTIVQQSMGVRDSEMVNRLIKLFNNECLGEIVTNQPDVCEFLTVAEECLAAEQAKAGEAKPQTPKQASSL